jgi:serine/threonine protein kinase
LEEVEARYYIKQIIEAINYCHKYKVVHRDLKPDNLIISEAMEVKLIDFGLSNRINKPSRVSSD